MDSPVKSLGLAVICNRDNLFVGLSQSAVSVSSQRIELLLS